MKRDPIESYKYGVYRFFLIFNWYLCKKCNKEFRREFGWKFIGRPYIGLGGTWKYICQECAQTKEIANKYAIEIENACRTSIPTTPPPGQGERI